MNAIVKRYEDAGALLNWPGSAIGEAVFENIENIVANGNFDEIGDDLKAVILDAQAGSIDALEAVEKTLVAIFGSGFAKTAETC